MNTATQPIDALALADQLDEVPETGADPDLIERSAAELRRLVAENEQLRADLEAIGAGGIDPLMPSKLTQQDIADSALLGNIESPFNACMHQEHCKRWKAQADQQHQRKLSNDNDLQRENGQLITSSSTAPQPQVVEQPQGEQKPRAWLHIDRLGGEQAFTNEPPPSLKAKCQPLYTHSQNLNCKSTQARLATLWGYVKVDQQPQSKQEPVSWIENFEGSVSYGPIHEAARKLPVGVRFDLYTHPQPLRQPLTLEQIAVAFGWKNGLPPLPREVHAARVVERAHEIGGEA